MFSLVQAQKGKNLETNDAVLKQFLFSHFLSFAFLRSAPKLPWIDGKSARYTKEHTLLRGSSWNVLWLII